MPPPGFVLFVSVASLLVYIIFSIVFWFYIFPACVALGVEKAWERIEEQKAKQAADERYQQPAFPEQPPTPTQTVQATSKPQAKRRADVKKRQVQQKPLPEIKDDAFDVDAFLNEE